MRIVVLAALTGLDLRRRSVADASAKTPVVRPWLRAGHDDFGHHVKAVKGAEPGGARSANAVLRDRASPGSAPFVAAPRTEEA
jgi:hypothetical protein